MKHILTAVSFLLLAAASAAADDDVRSKPLMLHAPAPAARALEYALLPDLMDTTPGNAADHYRQAIKNMKQDAPPSDWPRALRQWMAAPLKDLPREEVGRFLQKCESTFREVDAGARCEDCDWGFTEKVREKGFGTLEPDIVRMPQIAILLGLRVRCQLAEGRTADAVRSLQTGFALSRHVGDEPAFTCAFVGMDMGGAMLDRLEEVMQRPDAPSFYWPLTDLPRPLFDLRQLRQGERLIAYGHFPGMVEMASDLNAKPWTPEQVEKVTSLLSKLTSDDNSLLRFRDETEMLLHIAARHEAAKKVLIDEGRPKELVAAMPHVQVALRVSLLQYERKLDDLLKWRSLPYWEAAPAIDRAEKRIKQERDGPNGPAIPLTLTDLSFHSEKKMLMARTNMDRRVAALRCVEAVRLYAAAHYGKPPASLDDVKDVPIPPDPVSGKPFGYHAVGDRAFFTAEPFPEQPPIAGWPVNVTPPTYELIFNR